MNNDDGLLDFLTDGLVGRERDAVTRAYYGYATGDPNSEPVGVAVLLTACMRKLAQVPERLKSGTAEFQTVVAEARALEKGLIERVNRENATVVSAVKDEMYRAVTTWNETITRAMRLEEKAHAMTDELKPVVTSAQRIAQDFHELKGDLKVHAESGTKIVEGVEAIKTMHYEDQMRFRKLTTEARGDWITIGLLAGLILAAMLSQLPWWGALITFAGVIVSVQWLSRQSWDFARRLSPNSVQGHRGLGDKKSEAEGQDVSSK
jgi:hypothetical protein